MWENFREKKVKINYIAPSFSHVHGCSRFFLKEILFPRSAEDAASASLMHLLVVLKAAHESA